MDLSEAIITGVDYMREGNYCEGDEDDSCHMAILTGVLQTTVGKPMNEFPFIDGGYFEEDEKIVVRIGPIKSLIDGRVGCETICLGKCGRKEGGVLVTLALK